MTKRHLKRNIVTAIQQLHAGGAELVSSLDVANQLGESRTTVGRYLNALVDAGRIRKTGVGSATRYALVDLVEWLEQRPALEPDDGDAQGALAAYQAYEAARGYALRLRALVTAGGRRRKAHRVGIVVVTPDSAAGRYAPTILGTLARRAGELRADGMEPAAVTVGQAASDFATAFALPVLASVPHLRAASRLEGLIGSLKALIDGYLDGTYASIELIHASFIESAHRGVTVDRVLPVEGPATAQAGELSMDVARRYVEAMVLCAVSETIALHAVTAGGHN